MASSSTSLDETLQQILLNQQNLQTNFNNLTSEITNIKTRLLPPGFQPHDPGPPPQYSTTTIKLDIPKFDGSNPLGWLFKINQFFEFHHTPDDQRIKMASFYMEGEALTWYQWMHSNGQLISWPIFIQSLELRFAPQIGSWVYRCRST